MPRHRRLRIALVAEEAAGARVLKALHSAPEAPEIAAVLTTTESDGMRRPQVAAAAAKMGLDVRPASELGASSFAESIRNLYVDLLLNVHSLAVLSPGIVRAARIGSFNLHPGPLPEFAGLNAPSWAIYEGQTAHAVTLHWMDAGIDTGAIAYHAAFGIEDSDTGLSLTAKCVQHGVPLVRRLIADATQDPHSIPTLGQDLRRRRYFGREVPNAGNVVWSLPADEIVRFIRAADYSPFESPWGIPRARLGDQPVGIAKASLTGESTDELPGIVGQALPRGAIAVAAADEWVAVRRMWHNGRYIGPRELCAPGVRLDDGGFEG
jgi:UDP-4-amino-4-deoxy-L-arabinose formyltransferase/UDP-glucuronic acid dehydrogenase (UDP-4-keto-hexauronic acid decarboxylating)